MNFKFWLLCESESRQKKVLVIGIDGCRPDALLVARIPHLEKLMKQGSYSYKAQTGDITISGPGWSSLLTGVWRQKHGVQDNKLDGANFDEFPDFMSRIKKLQPKIKTASVVHWQPITRIVTADHNTTHRSDADVAKVACKILSKAMDVVFVHFDDVDYAGQDYGFNPKESGYIHAIESVDNLIGKILQAVKSRKTYGKEDWLVVVSTDHGGSGKEHGRNIPEHRTIFLIVSGPSAARGEIKPAPKIVDVPATVFNHMGISVDPAWKLDGKPVGLKNN